MNIPLFISLLKVGLVFAFMLAGIRYKLGIGLSIPGGSLVLGLIFGIGPGDWLATRLPIIRPSAQHAVNAYAGAGR